MTKLSHHNELNLELNLFIWFLSAMCSSDERLYDTDEEFELL